MGRRRCLPMILPLLLLTACAGGRVSEAEELTNRTRTAYLELTACAGSASVTADYGLRVYDYALDFTYQREGETVLILTAPEDVAGVTATIAQGETGLEFDGVAVETGPVDPSGLSPLDAIPALLRYAREGYVAECALEGEEGGKTELHLLCRDPEKGPGEGLECELWLDGESLALLRGELSQGGLTVIQCAFSDWTMTGAEKTEE